jgi:uncharacterized protein (DUF1800 family)
MAAKGGSGMNVTLRALNRFGLGARPGERDRISDARGWLKAQLDGGTPALHPSEATSAAAIADAVRALRMPPGQRDERERREARRHLIELATNEARAALGARIASERPFVERLVAFWSNHLCVSAGSKVLVAPLAGSYERDVIRPHVLGRFEDMVLASAKHPAMLAYLDNFQSIGPSSRGARDSQRNHGAKRGLNENYARELLELHTLGVNGGYTQEDVQELARILTGWTIDGIAAPGARVQPRVGMRGRGAARRARLDAGTPLGFAFRALLHEPGTKTVLEKRYAEGGVGEGERAIRALCQHRSTSRFVATKLAMHFISDNPPPEAIDRLARTFRSSDGDLKAIARALIDEPEAWREDSRKFRTPQDWFVAVMRAIGASEVNPNAPAVLRQLRQPLWSPPSPKGFGDAMLEWADPDSLLNRGELAGTIARLPSVAAIDPLSLLEVVDVPAGNPLPAMIADASIAARERVALAIAGPAFQWR